jgi:cysteinyl-tRNA synthetase
MYVCGPTVSGRPHIGHGRFALVFDVLRRYLLWSGLDVDYVSNITDIEDKIILRAQTDGLEPAQVAARYEAVWWQAMDGLGVMRPTKVPYATQYVDQMVALIERLLEAGAAYETEDGIYFRSESVPDYGLLARQSLESMIAGARVEMTSDKQSPIDFVLWKRSKPGEPVWESSIGPGRPGWHTECVVMSLDLLGEGFDLHGGGLDLAFPHHENERAQASADGKVFARRWMHNGFVEMGGEKMSKSIGNVMDLIDVVEHHDPRAYRMLVLQAHYRSPVEVTEASIAQAEATLERLDTVARRATLAGLSEDPDAAEASASVIDEFVRHMDDDLDTPGAMAVLFGEVTKLNRALDEDDHAAAAAAWATIADMARAVGLPLMAGAEEVPSEISDLAAARDAARLARDYAEADRLRDELQGLGWLVEDGAQGTTVRRA